MTLYFNHSAIENASREEVHGYLEEIIKLRGKTIEQEESICYFQDFWDVKFSGYNLRSYLSSMKDKDPVKGVITSVMNGPYYYSNVEVNEILAEPDFNRDGFTKLLLNVCFKDNQHKLLSLMEEKSLKESQYNINRYLEAEVNFEVINILGERGLEEFFSRQCSFKTIQEVFDNLEKKYDSLIVMDSAKKSAKKHDFRGGLLDIYQAVSKLVEIELPGLLAGENDEIRKSRFRADSGMEISKETLETLAVDRYRKEREFNIPELGKVLCQWHIKVHGNNTRIHYHIDKKHKKVYIVHCGKHLNTIGYKS